MPILSQHIPHVWGVGPLYQRHAKNFYDLYGKDEDRLFRANALRLTLASNIPVLFFLLIFFNFPGGEQALKGQRLIFSGILGASLFVQLICYVAMMKNKYNLARAIFMTFTYGAIFSTLALTGGFPSSIASPAVVIPVVLSYCLYGGRVSLISSSLFLGLLIVSHFIVSGFHIKLPVLRAVKESDTTQVIIYASVLSIVIAMITIFDKTYREFLEQSKVAIKCKSEFLATMSHEIRTPMNGVLGIAQVLEKTNLDSQQKEMVSIINRSGDTLLKIINDILDFSKLESGKMSMEPSYIDPRTQIHDVVQMLRRPAEKNGLSLKHNICEPLPASVHADGGRILQVLINLVGNAIKFTDKGSVTIHVRSYTKKNHAYIKYEIQDTGVGIPEKEQQAIFTDFYQVDQSTTRQAEGTGLGLAICQQIVAAMGGKIGLESQVGKGSTFWFELGFDNFEMHKSEKVKSNEIPEALTVSDTPHRHIWPADVVQIGPLPVFLQTFLEPNKFNLIRVKTNAELEDYIKAAPVDPDPAPIFVLRLPADPEKYSEVVRRLSQHRYLGQNRIVGIQAQKIVQITPVFSEVKVFQDGKLADEKRGKTIAACLLKIAERGRHKRGAGLKSAAA